MAASLEISPRELIPSYGNPVEGSNGFSIQIGSNGLPGLELAKADRANGDGREVLRALLSALYDSWLYMKSHPEEYILPRGYTISRSTRVDDESRQMLRTYTIRLLTTIDESHERMADEPDRGQ